MTPILNPTISFYTLGCRLNQSETAVLERSVETDGFRLVDFKESADVVVINTCTVTAGGDTDTRRLVHKINRLNPRSRIALIGCQAQMDKGKLLELPNVHWVIGNARKMELSSILQSTSEAMEPQVITPAIPRDSFTILPQRVPLWGTYSAGIGVDHRHRRVNLRIQDGCDSFCSFCVIPYARGRARSREFDDILREARGLAAAGHKEVVLTGINLGTYRYKDHTLMDVVEALEQIEGLARIRISSIEPTTIPEPLIRKMAGRTKLCRHLHIPLQSGSDAILKAMKRKYSAEEFERFIRMADELVPQICTGTDMIVGFPGETEEDFQRSADRLREWPVDYAHVFSYSRRQMAHSGKLPSSDRIPAEIIERRSQILRDLSLRKRQMFHGSLLGTRQGVLFEEKKKDEWTGLTDNYARVAVKSDQPLRNEFRTVRMVTARGATVEGTLA
ncbi:MAG: tRNA (N(6)-L-threonylcarbamoyladenosine(37)-C(2))-methylthiotransferase MtaB [Candidatus Omnitrophica bacterium]|nr:tRNA (N(6)-L-threonylcarbamoyladenosine(37)-C(2))-methylthiotransferase MtaB [Candidatus Omnitrophota bacterium]